MATFKQRKGAVTAAAPGKVSYGKYGAQKAYVDGIRFDSKGEAGRYKTLKLLQEKGLISNLELQPEFEIIPTYKHNGKTVRRSVYRADFRYMDAAGNTVVEDYKGFETPVFKLKKKLVEWLYPEVTIKLVR